MDHVFILLLTGVTSVVAYIVGVKWLRLSRYGLWIALGKTCEAMGWTLVFFLLNLIVGVSVMFVGRFFMETFVSLYHLSDVTLVALSLLQALAFQAWRAGSRPAYPSEVRYGDPFRHER
jgi:hypothetical protein